MSLIPYLNEDTPFITENDSVLYFSSQGHENMGGYDIFKSKIGPANQWSAPENLMYPINTTDDNLFYYPWHNARIIYASLIRPGGFGKEDICAIQPEEDKPLNDLFAELIQPAAPVVAAVTPSTAQPQPAGAVIAETASNYRCGHICYSFNQSAYRDQRHNKRSCSCCHC